MQPIAPECVQSQHQAAGRLLGGKGRRERARAAIYVTCRRRGLDGKGRRRLKRDRGPNAGSQPDPARSFGRPGGVFRCRRPPFDWSRLDAKDQGDYRPQDADSDDNDDRRPRRRRPLPPVAMAVMARLGERSAARWHGPDHGHAARPATVHAGCREQKEGRASACRRVVAADLDIWWRKTCA